MTDPIGSLRAFLGAATPEPWFEAAIADEAVLLLDHANCEKKAASTALSMVFRYERHGELVARMSKLAREELRHFEQVQAIMKRRGIAWRPLSASRYAGGLRQLVRAGEPDRLIDLLICGAFVEARSCERFAGLSGRLDDELNRFYGRLLKSEARHFEVYLALAASFIDAQALRARIDVFRQSEAELVTKADAAFRFHSGPPSLEVQTPSTSRMPLASASA
ncbi:MAG: tRNA-(ms[2]io[6]A)-hydroxylase [Pseudomonadota bacterium]|nr:tRNA-(ms[2]io[6]A)-hydroxylase [Pseudomonadota bacterium]